MNKPILYINACVRKESRTEKLAQTLLSNLNKPFDEIRLTDIDFPAISEEYLCEREFLVAQGDFENPMLAHARRFSEAQIIVIAAPYWDLSFPAALKQYLETVNVVGITFAYSPEGKPVSLCRANRLFYVTTAGGYFVPEDYGFGYVKALAQNYYGIREVRKIEAVGLDIEGADVEEIMKKAQETCNSLEY